MDKYVVEALLEAISECQIKKAYALNAQQEYRDVWNQEDTEEGRLCLQSVKKANENFGEKFKNAVLDAVI